jgi:hypothetical protein
VRPTPRARYEEPPIGAMSDDMEGLKQMVVRSSVRLRCLRRESCVTPRPIASWRGVAGSAPGTWVDARPAIRCCGESRSQTHQKNDAFSGFFYVVTCV